MPSTKFKTSVRTVTPAMAEEWLGLNTHNRQLTQRRVDVLVGAIKRGEWKLNGDAIRFSKEGVLLDGQHRLWAILMSDTAVDTIVTEGLEPDTQPTMDGGQKRSLRDALLLMGVGSSKPISAVLNYFWKIQTGQVRNVQAMPTIAQALDLYATNPEGFADAATIGQRVRTRFRVGAAMVSAVYYQFASIDQEAADFFFEKLQTGANLDVHDPIYLLRSYLERNTAQGVRASTVVTHAMIVKAWNCYRNGEQLSKLVWRTSGTNPEPFPEPL